ncbi:hypothetical protein [Hazenella coriacea]|uniref:hypothetical protein n=1 Tax=Hazenella coriacea TaxID=1179467 RepID=UPI00104B248E|nr:hypothetical protein [Hazenella coriacea]
MKEDQLEFLKDETKNFRESVQKERESFQSTFDRYLTILTTLPSVLIAVLGFILIYFFGQSKKELKEDISKLDGEIKESITKLEKEFGEAETNLQKKMDKKIGIADQQISRFLEEQLKDHIEKVDALIRMSERECMYQKSRILVIGTDDQLKEMGEFELKAIRQRGINHIESINLNIEELKKKLEQDSFDILIYHYLGKGGSNDDEGIVDPQVTVIVDLLKRNNQEIPLIVYTYYGEHNWLHREDKKVVDSYRWAVMANMPVTLLGHLFTIAHAFHKEAKIGDSIH